MDKILCIIWLRFKLLRNSLHSHEGVLNLVSKIVLSIFWGLLSLGVAAVFGVTIWQAEHPVDREFLLTLYYIVCFVCSICGLILPLLFAANNVKLEISRLIMFPIGYRRLFGISMAACAGSFEHLLYYPTLLVFCLIGIIMPGTYILAGFLFVFSLWIFNVVWGHTIALGIEVITKRRMGKEVLGLITVFFILLVGVGPAILEGIFGEHWAKDISFIQILKSHLIQAGRILAPALAAQGLGAVRSGELAPALRHLMWLWAWIVPGVLLGYFVFERNYAGTGGKKSRTKAKRRIIHEEDNAVLSSASEILSFLPSEVVAVAAKEWRYLMRSLVGKLNLVLIPVMVTLIVFAFARHLEKPVLGINAETVAFFGILLFITQTMSNLLNNSLAWERRGVQIYFFSPAPLKRVFLGKNLAIWCYSIVLFLLAVATWTVIKGLPGGITLLSGLLFFGVAVLSFTSIGNILSILFPVPKDISARDNSISQTAVLISVVSLAIVTTVTGIFVIVPAFMGLSKLQPLALAILLAILIPVYIRSLRFAARLFMEKREKVISALDSRA